MNPGTKAKTIWMILLAVLLVAVPAGMVYAEIGNGQAGVENTEEQETPGEVKNDAPNGECEVYQQQPPPPPPCLAYIRAYIARQLGEDWDCFERRVEDVEADAYRIMLASPTYVPPCDGEAPKPLPWRAWPERIVPPGPPPPPEPPITVSNEGHDVGLRDKAQIPDGDLEVLGAISSGIEPPYRSGLNAHGRAWTRAGYEQGVITEVVVNVWLDWWDGTRWIQAGSGFDSETEDCWRGLITARGLARDINAATGWYRVRSLHRVFVDDTLVYHRWRPPPPSERHLIFP